MNCAYPLRKGLWPLCFCVLFVWSCDQEKTRTPELQGIVELTQRALAFELPGRVLRVHVERGDVLEKGMAIAQLDATLEELTYQTLVAQARATKAELDLLYEGTRVEELERIRARVRGAEAEVRTRRRELDRVTALHESKAVTVSELDSVRSSYDKAVANQDEARGLLRELHKGPRAQEIQAGEARLQAAESNARASEERILRHVLYADGPAEVLDVPIEFGEYVSAGTTLVTVADTERPYVDVFVPQSRIAEVSVGAPVTVLADSLRAPIGGRIEHIARTMEYTPRFLFSPKERPYLVLRVRVRIADPERRLRAGVPAFVELTAPGPELALPHAPSRPVAPSAPTATGASPQAPAASSEPASSEQNAR